jgi:protoheme IX farnesyltransferase
MADSTSSVSSKSRISAKPRWKALAVLFKLRVVWLLLFAAVGGAFLAADGQPHISDMVSLFVAGGLTAAGSSALNQFLERGSDALMSRTRQRPLVTRYFPRPAALFWLALIMTFAPGLIVLRFNPSLTFFLLLGAFIYLVIYTIWLKPRTPLNIVIGGAAGSAAVLSGSAAVGNWNQPGALALALLIFLWTPTHFWSLAILYRDDYRHSKIPMLPANIDPRQAAAWVLLHTAATAVAALALALLPALGWLYAAPVMLATAGLLWQSVRLLARPAKKQARTLFITSNVYLGLILLLICLDLIVG